MLAEFPPYQTKQVIFDYYALAADRSGKQLVSVVLAIANKTKRKEYMGIVQFLVEQSGNPSGFIGELLLNTMDMAHGNAIRKALEPIHHDRGYSVLDIGCGSGYALRIMNSRFHDSQDLVTAFQTHYFRPDIHQACREIQRVLKPNGLFILSGDLYKIKYHLVGKYQFMEEYPELLKEEGFSEIKIFPYNGFMIAHSKK